MCMDLIVWLHELADTERTMTEPRESSKKHKRKDGMGRCTRLDRPFSRLAARACRY